MIESTQHLKKPNLAVETTKYIYTLENKFRAEDKDDSEIQSR